MKALITNAMGMAIIFYFFAVVVLAMTAPVWLTLLIAL